MDSLLTPAQFASMIDYALLRPYGTLKEMQVHCEEARQYGFAMVAIHPADIEFCLQQLQGCPVHVGAVVGFPLGQNILAVKEYETCDAIQRGAHEIDLMINLRALQSGEIELVRREIAAVVKACQAAYVISKIILETCYLSDQEKRTVCQMALDEGAGFVKTSTGFAPAGATVQDVRLMRSVVGQRLGVKAAGKIRTLAEALALIEAGANRLGTSSGVAIVEELMRAHKRLEADER